VKVLKDSEVPQLYYRFSNCREAGTFSAVFRIPGFKNSKWFRIGQRGDVAPGKARTLARRMVQEKCYRSDVDIVKAAQYGKITNVSQLLAWYGEYVKGEQITVDRANQINSNITKYLSPYFNERKILSLSLLVVKEFTRELATKLKISSARKVLGVLLTALKEASRLKLIKVNPCINFTSNSFYKKSETERSGRAGRLTMDEMPYIFKRLHEHPHAKTIALVQLTFLTFGRIGEYSQSKWSDWDQLNGTLKVKAKGGKDHFIYTNPIIDEVLTQLKRAHKRQGVESAYLFPSREDPNKSIHPNSASQVLKRFSKTNWSAHDVRKFANTWTQENNVNYIVGQWLLAHKMKDLDRTYIQTDGRDSCTRALHNWASVMLELGLLDSEKAVSAALARNRKALRQKLPHIMRSH